MKSNNQIWRPMTRAEFEVRLSRNRILGKETEPEGEYISYTDAIKLAIEIATETRMFIIKRQPGGIKRHLYEKIGEWLTKTIRQSFGGRYYKKDYE